MPKLTLVLWLSYLAISLGLRLLIQLRKTGKSGFMLARSRIRLELIASAMFVSSLFAGLASPILACTVRRTSTTRRASVVSCRASACACVRAPNCR